MSATSTQRELCIRHHNKHSSDQARKSTDFGPARLYRSHNYTERNAFCSSSERLRGRCTHCLELCSNVKKRPLVAAEQLYPLAWCQLRFRRGVDRRPRNRSRLYCTRQTMKASTTRTPEKISVDMAPRGVQTFPYRNLVPHGTSYFGPAQG